MSPDRLFDDALKRCIDTIADDISRALARAFDDAIINGEHWVTLMKIADTSIAGQRTLHLTMIREHPVALCGHVTTQHWEDGERYDAPTDDDPDVCMLCRVIAALRE